MKISRFTVFFCLLISFALHNNLYAEDKTDDELKILRKTSQAFTKVAKKAMPAVVFIKVEKVIRTRNFGSQAPFNDPFGFFGDEFFERFFHDRGYAPRQFLQEGQGSGFIISKDGYILTNNHVVGGADKILVKLQDGRELEAVCIGSDPSSEVAVIKVDTKDLPYLELGDSASLEIGEWVIAVGNPFGLTETLTVGVVSAKGRNNIGIAEYEDFIQTDAAINPGNSGGPLLNIDGEVVGINTAIFSQSGGYMGIGFAIPINMARVIKDQLVKEGKFTRGFLGVSLNPSGMSEDLAKAFGLKTARGALITGIKKDSAADQAGMKEEDIVLAVNGENIQDNSDFRNKIAMIPPDTKTDLLIWRDGKEKNVSVTVGTLEQEEQITETKTESRTEQNLGLSVTDLTEEMAKRFGYQPGKGVIVSSVEAGSSAERAGIEPGNLIISVNRKAVNNTKEFKEAVEKSSRKGRVLLRVANFNMSWFVILPI